MKFSEIPTKNKLHIIDNFPNAKYKYIVEGDKIYASLKNEDNWTDVSNNIIIRQNLFNFISQHGWNNYEDGEKQIYDLLQKGNFNYNNYLEEKHNADSLALEKQKILEERAKRDKEAAEIWWAQKRKRKQDFDSANQKISDYLSKEPSFKDLLGDLNVSIPEEQEEDIPVIKISRKENTKPELIKLVHKDTTSIPKLVEIQLPDDPQFTEHFIAQANEPIKIQEKELDDPVVKISNPITLSDLTGPLQRGYSSESIDYLHDILQLGWNGLTRNWQKLVTGGEGTVAKMETPEEYIPRDTTQRKTAIGVVPLSYTGDTIRVSPRLYRIPESIRTDQYTWGTRNRGDQYTTIETEAAPISLMNSFQKYSSQLDPNRHYVGIDSEGNFKIGPFDTFSTGDKMAPLMYWETSGFAKDTNGNFKHYDAGGGNGNNQMPVLVTPNGDVKINLFSGRGYNNFNPDLFDSVQGGHFIFKVGNEIRVVSGSLRNLDNEFEAMKRRQGVDSGIVYQLDNGPANTGLRTYDKKITAEDLRKYELRNNRGIGNFMYIKGESPQFQQEQNILSKYLYNLPKFQQGGILGYVPTINRNLNQTQVSNPVESFPMEQSTPIEPPKTFGYQREFNNIPIEESKSEEPEIQESKHYSSEERQEFVDDLYNAYVKVLSERGIDTRYAKYLVAQDAHETNFGQSYAGNFNFGNITLGSSKRSYTKGEDSDASGKKIIQKFRNYNSLEDYINDKIDLLNNSRYHAFNGNPSGFFQRVKNGGYAEDPQYVAKLKRLYYQIKINEN